MGILCDVMKVSRSGYYKFLKAKPPGISAQQMQWEADFKALFQAAQQSYGTRREELKQLGMIYSMSRKANCWDNAVVERFFRSLKSECTDHYQLEDPQHARQVIMDYIMMFYNSKRLHFYLGCQSPMQFEKHYLDSAA